MDEAIHVDSATFNLSQTQQNYSLNFQTQPHQGSNTETYKKYATALEA